jgi:hypothetical protein
MLMGLWSLVITLYEQRIAKAMTAMDWSSVGLKLRVTWRGEFARAGYTKLHKARA